jgi:hypothetical protein
MNPLRTAALVGCVALVGGVTLAGCAASAPPTAPGTALATAGPSTGPSAGATGPHLVLYVSNQSFEDERVGIRVEIDDRVVVDDTFHVETQHTWVEYPLTLPEGPHRLRATSTTGVTATHDLDTPAEGTRWAVLSYWYYPGEPRSFTFQVHDRPVGFD